MKILIQHYNMTCGGIETSIVNFVENLKSENNITINLLSKTGLMLNNVPKDVTMTSLDGGLSNRFDASMGYQVGKKPSLFLRIFKSIFRTFYYKFVKNKVDYRQLYSNSKVKDKYDVAISYSALCYENNKFVLDYVDSQVKAAYIHCTPERFNKYIVSQLYKFDVILCVSKSCSEKMKTLYPRLADKVDYLYNFLDQKAIQEKAGQEDIKYDNCFNFVTVARVAPMKGHLRFANIINKLITEHNKYNFRWIVVGDGPDMALLKDFINDNHLQNYIECVGVKTNPYPYMKQADLFVLPSAFAESWGIVLVESMSLGVPVMTTNLVSAKEVVGDYGIVCDNSEEGLYNALKQVLQNPDCLKIYRERLKKYKFDNEANKKRFYDIINERNHE